MATEAPTSSEENKTFRKGKNGGALFHRVAPCLVLTLLGALLTSGCTSVSRMGRGAPSVKSPPEIERVEALVPLFTPREAEVSLKLFLRNTRGADGLLCHMKELRLQWMMDDRVIGTSIHDMAMAPCPRTTKMAVPLQGRISYLPMPATEGQGGKVRMQQAKITFQGTLTVAAEGGLAPIRFSVEGTREGR